VNDALKSIIILTLISIGGGGVAVFFNSLFSHSIEARAEGMQRSAVERMFPVGAVISTVNGNKMPPARYWIGKKDSIVVAYAFTVETRGYAGTINSMVGIDTAGTVLGVKILSAASLPAFGMTVDDFIPANSLWGRLSRRADLPATWFTEQFKGTSLSRPYIIDTLSRWKTAFDVLRKERREGNMVSAVSGATASTQTVIYAIQKTAASFLPAVKGSAR
jgi:Na+-translocating ferredoxin:NAD+ oxidoreductase RnfG subunit